MLTVERTAVIARERKKVMHFSSLLFLTLLCSALIFCLHEAQQIRIQISEVETLNEGVSSSVFLYAIIQGHWANRLLFNVLSYLHNKG